MKLVEACKVGDLEAVQNAVEVDGIDPAFEKNLPLRTAARHGHFEVVKYLLDQGANPGERGCTVDIGGFTKERYNEIIAADYKVAFGKEPNVDDAAIVQACAIGNETMVDLFLQDDRVLQVLGTGKSTALCFAIANNHFGIVKKLWSNCSDEHIKVPLGSVRIWHAIAVSRDMQMYKYFERIWKQEIGSAILEAHKSNALCAAARCGQLDIVKFLVDNDTRCSGAVKAAFQRCEQLPCLEYLLANGRWDLEDQKSVEDDLRPLLNGNSHWKDQCYEGIKLLLHSKPVIEYLRRYRLLAKNCIFGLVKHEQVELLHYMIDELGFDCIMGNPGMGKTAVNYAFRDDDDEILKIYIRRKEVQQALRYQTKPIPVAEIVPFFYELQDEAVKTVQLVCSIDLFPLESNEIRATIYSLAYGREIIISYKWEDNLYMRAYDLLFDILSKRTPR